MHVGRNCLGARAIAVDQDQLSHTSPKSDRHRGRSPNGTDAYDSDIHHVLRSSLPAPSGKPSANRTAAAGSSVKLGINTQVSFVAVAALGPTLRQIDATAGGVRCGGNEPSAARPAKPPDGALLISDRTDTIRRQTMKHVVLAFAFVMAGAAPVMAEQGKASEIEGQGWFGFKNEPRDLDRPRDENCPSHCNSYSFGDLGRLYCTRVCGQTY